MDNKGFVRASRRAAAMIATYINDEAPIMVARKTLRFIDGNFRAQGWQGAVFKPWKDKLSNAGRARPGRILIVTGRLRRSVNYTTNGQGEVRFYNNTPYADIHNRGGIINKVAKVSAFTRRRWVRDDVSAPGARKPKIVHRVESEHQVKAHTRTMKIVMPQRQFMPYDDHGSPVLDDSVKRELERNFKRILSL